jgi:hypothetical protein
MSKTLMIGIVVIVAIVAYAWYARSTAYASLYTDPAVAPPAPGPAMAPSRLTVIVPGPAVPPVPTGDMAGLLP